VCFALTRERITLHVKPPFRLDLTVWALRRREGNAIDRWNGEQYDRIVVVQSRPVKLAVTQRVKSVAPTLDVTVESARKLGSRGIEEVEHLVRKMLGLATDLEPFYELADSHDFLKPLVERFSGVKPPRFASLFEALANAIACQQVTLDLGIILLNRLSKRFGVRVVDHDASVYSFPLPSDLAEVSEESIKELGFSRQKARAIKELALRVGDGTLDLEFLEGATNEEAAEYLSNIRGIGRWSAEYVLLRGLGRMDVFPGDDIGAQNNLRRLFHLDEKPNYEEIRRLTSAWHPYEGVVYFHLLLEKLRATGTI
jgi:DNA-3-methyladenine glycosylase II